VLADPVIARLLPDVEQIVERAEDLLPVAAAGSVDVRVALPDGRRLNGTVPGVHGTLLRSVTYSRVNPRHRLVSWVRFLALTAAHPDREFEAATLGRATYGGPRGTTVSIVRLPRMQPEAALEHLAALAALYDDGMCEPLPLACKTSAAYAGGGNAAKEWESEWSFPREDQELEHQLAFGGVLTFEQLLARAGFDQSAHRLWDAPLDWEHWAFA
jgi:exodeoxyribonuclease V gamma subunit